jgi:hypothetical protein
MLIPLAAAFIYVGRRWYRIVRLGNDADDRFDQPARRFRHGDARRRRPRLSRATWGWMHYTFIVAFIGLFIGTRHRGRE